MTRISAKSPITKRIPIAMEQQKIVWAHLYFARILDFRQAAPGSSQNIAKHRYKIMLVVYDSEETYHDLLAKTVSIYRTKARFIEH